MADARRALDGALGVSGWALPGHQPHASAPPEPGAPWWWQGAEEASQGFLSAMGVKL